MSAQSVILIVDDDPVGRSSLQALLAREPYQLIVAADGPTAVLAASENPPDLILLDVMMPGMDGFEVTRQIRALPALAEVPILLLTALDDNRSRLIGIEAGADDFVTKPYDRIELRARIRTITRLNRFRRLTQQREQYHQLFDRSPCGLLILDRTGRVKEMNSVASNLLQTWSKNQGPDVLIRLLPPARYTELCDMLAAASRDPATTPRAEFIAKTSSGSPVWFELAVSPARSDEGEVFQVALVDRTAERLLGEELRQVQKLESIGQLAGGIAHDFNNLLTIINGFSMLAIDQMHPDDPARTMLEEVYNAGERAASLTRQLLVFSRKQLLTPVNLDLNTLVREIEKMIRRLIGEHISVRTVAARDLWRISADPGQIEQVLFNLAANARDAMPTGGQLTIETSNFEGPANNPADTTTQWVRMVVRDTGTGMPQEVQDRIFEPFFTTKEVGKGTGLGLATVYGIVKQCGGRIAVSSTVGQGTQFTIDFPRLSTAAATDASAVAFTVPKGNATILLAEDEGSVRGFAEAALISAGYTVIPAIDGEEALSKANRFDGPIHLLFTDSVMPRLGGRALAERLHATRPDTKVLYTSGYDDDAITQQGVLLGKVAFLPKPYSTLRLLQKVHEVLAE